MFVPRSGVSYTQEAEWRLAAKAYNYTWKAFTALDGEEQSEIIAMYRIEGQLEGLLAKEQAEHNKPRKR